MNLKETCNSSSGVLRAGTECKEELSQTKPRNMANAGNNRKQDLYFTTLFSPAEHSARYHLPWPLSRIYFAIRSRKVNVLADIGLILTGICFTTIIFVSLSQRSLFSLCEDFQIRAMKVLPFLLVLNVYYWVALTMKRWNKLFSWKYLVLACFLQELFSETFKFVDQITRNVLGLLVFVALNLALTFTQNRKDFPTVFVISGTTIVRFVLFGILPSTLYKNQSSSPLLIYCSCFLGLYLANMSMSLTQTVGSEPQCDKIPVIRRRRQSSIDSTVSSRSSFSMPGNRRRTSMPVLGQRRISMSSMDITTLGEAHGMITDMLADPSLPPNVTSTLRIIGDMMAPLLQHGLTRNTFSSPLVTVLEKSNAQVQEDVEKVKDQPDLKDDTPYSMKQRLSRQLGGNVRRMSSSYTTTTSATGMPNIDIDFRRATTHNIHEGMSGSRSPSPKSNRAKSYAGIFSSAEIRKEFLKSRSFCQPSPPVGRKDSSVARRGSLGKDSDDGIFRAEVISGDPTFMDENKSDGSDDEAQEYRTESETLNTTSNSNSVEEIANRDELVNCESEGHETNSEIQNSKCDNDSSKTDLNSRKYSESSDGPKIELDRRDSDSKPQEVELNHLDFRRNISSPARKRDSISSISSKPSPLAQRKTENLTIAQVAPVRKNSRDETATRRVSQESLLSSRKSSAISYRQVADVQNELAVSATEDVNNLMNTMYDWEFPIFELNEKCNVMTQLILRIFQVSGFFSTFSISQETFLRYFRAVENGYHDIPYHNRIHAADVLHAVYYMTNQKIPGFGSTVHKNNSRRGSLKDELGKHRSSESNYRDPEDDSYGCLADVIPELELMALYTAAAMHDFDHPGRTNAFLVATLNPKALLYNDRSVLENHHAAASWSLLVSDPLNNFISSLDAMDFKRFRFIVIELILSTDLKKHFDFISEWNAKISEQGGGINWSNEADRLLVLQMSIKMADINGPSKSWDLHFKWTERIVEEFYLQGDDEQSLGMPISPYMDRTQPRVPPLQASFIKHLVGPLFNCYARAGLMPGEWRDQEDDDEEEDDGEDSQSFGNDSDFDRSDPDDDTDIKDENKNEKLERTKKKRVPFYCIVSNIDENYQKWQTLIAEEERKVSEDSQDNDTTDRDSKGDIKVHGTIEEEEENESP